MDDAKTSKRLNYSFRLCKKKIVLKAIVFSYERQLLKSPVITDNGKSFLYSSSTKINESLIPLSIHYSMKNRTSHLKTLVKYNIFTLHVLYTKILVLNIGTDVQQVAIVVILVQHDAKLKMKCVLSKIVRHII